MKHILVIEDNDADAELIRILLDEANFKHRFYHSTSLKGGFDILQEHEIDIVLLDLSLQDSIGFNTLKNYQKEAADTPVIILTGNNNEVVGMQSVKAGAQDFLIKQNFDAKRLVSSIRFSIQRFKAQAKFKQEATELSIKEKRAREAHQLAHFGNWEMDIVSYAMKWSDETYRIFGFQPGCFTPTLKDYLEYVHVGDKEKVNDFFHNVIKDGKVGRVEHRLVINNRTLKYLAVQARVNYDELTNKILLIGTVQDITYQKDNRLPESDEQQELTNEKNSRFTRLSYNIRTPLSSIVNLLYLLEKSNISNQQKELLDGLKNSVDDLSVVLNNLLNYSLFMSEDLRSHEEVFPLRELLDNVIRSGQFKTEQAEMAFESELLSELPAYIKGDESKIQQVLLNLLELAIMHTVQEEKIRMEIGLVESDMLQVSIQYSGSPVSVDLPAAKEDGELMKMIFGDDQDEKTVLPHLSTFIATKLTKLLNGKLEISTADSPRQLLKLQLPLEISKNGKSKDQTGVINKKINILLVEDHFLNQIATRKVLTSWSELVTVVTADNGEEALAQFGKEKIDLILMDLKIPKISGIEAARIIREKSQVPIIALTASSSKQEEERCFTVGMNDYISKPISPEELYSKILQLI